ncbi:MAG: hypothetical protein ACI8SK_001368 [Shewanella sp.]|jgi:hypothetical protein
MNKQLSDATSVDEELVYSDLSLSDVVDNGTFQTKKVASEGKVTAPVLARIHKEGALGFFGQFVYLINMLDVAIEVSLRNVMTRYNNQPGSETTESYIIPAKQKLHLGMTSSGKVANGTGFEYTVQTSKVSE